MSSTTTKAKEFNDSTTKRETSYREATRNEIEKKYEFINRFD